MKVTIRKQLSPQVQKSYPEKNLRASQLQNDARKTFFAPFLGPVAFTFYGLSLALTLQGCDVQFDGNLLGNALRS